ncbi:MAG: RdgB/HAM1 family non-canonical purine NTP pyrophosphatase [Bacteroidota bacterium]|jgi:non-canonical purine NTP pyrophosphatase (RdgB/HAM1 family)
MPAEKKILLATGNHHKLSEFNDIAYDLRLPITFIDLKHAGISTFPDETGITYLQNARIKAMEAYSKSGMPSLADDSGLEVISLCNSPGIYSARYAGHAASDSENRKKLLEVMQTDIRRTARFVCVLCYIDADTEEYFVGAVSGSIALKEAGKDGFGYDSLFIPAGYKHTFAEMYAEEKNQISHRAHAMRAFSEWYKQKIK